MTHHFFTVDVEEYFQVSAFENLVPRDSWPFLESRIARSVIALLGILDRHRVQGTFFVLGWIAEHRPEVVRAIAEAGHEIASHGHGHQRVTRLTQEEFRADVRRAKRTLEDVVGREVIGYRAPSFSIVPGREWAFDVLLEEGYRFDSSLFPIRRSRGYGYPGAPIAPHVIERPAGRLMEFPLTVLRRWGQNIPAAGGGYFRILPLALTRAAFEEQSRRGQPGVFYMHPWELDVGQPRVAARLLTRIRHYGGISRTAERLSQLLEEHAFTAIGPTLPDFEGSLGEIRRPAAPFGADKSGVTPDISG